MFIGSCYPGDPFYNFESLWLEIYNMLLGNYGPDDIFVVNPENCSYDGTVYLNLSHKNSVMVLNDNDKSYGGSILF
jgi:hypothetical protein